MKDEYEILAADTAVLGRPSRTRAWRPDPGPCLEVHPPAVGARYRELWAAATSSRDSG